jgi:Flp pilus assembly protein TadD
LANDEDGALPNLALIIDDFAKHRYRDALVRAEAQPESGLNTFVMPLVRAWILVGQKKTDEALAVLSDVNDVNGFAVLYRVHEALINDVAGRNDAAIAAYTDAVAKRGQPNLRLTQLLGGLYERLGKTDEARAQYDAYVDVRPTTSMFDDAYERLKTGRKPTSEIRSAADGLAEAMFSVASAIRQQNSFESSLFFAQLALHLKPKFPLAKLLVAEVLEGDNRLAEANEVYNSLGKEKVYGWIARLRVADNLDELDKTEDAIKLLRGMAKERPKSVDALIELGDMLRRHERFEEAVEVYDQAKRRIHQIKPHHWSLFYASGIALERSKHWKRAEADFLEALKLEPDQPFVLNYLGYSWVEQGKNLEKAQEFIERAVARRPQDGYIVDSLGWVLYRLGNIPDAVKNLERAVELRPQDPVINDHLGDAYWHAGRHAEAKFQWHRALSFEPEKDEVAKIEKKLAEGLPPDSAPGKGI